jgi:hypothetical protein
MEQQRNLSDTFAWEFCLSGVAACFIVAFGPSKKYSNHKKEAQMRFGILSGYEDVHFGLVGSNTMWTCR